MTTGMSNLSAVQADMVARLKRGDSDVLAEILQSFGGLIIHHLRSSLPALNEADLEEIVAEALFRLWTSRDSYVAARGSLLNWLLNIARNAAIDTLRLGWRQARLWNGLSPWPLSTYPTNTAT